MPVPSIYDDHEGLLVCRIVARDVDRKSDPGRFKFHRAAPTLESAQCRRVVSEQAENIEQSTSGRSGTDRPMGKRAPRVATGSRFVLHSKELVLLASGSAGIMLRPAMRPVARDDFLKSCLGTQQRLVAGGPNVCGGRTRGGSVVDIISTLAWHAPISSLIGPEKQMGTHGNAAAPRSS